MLPLRETKVDKISPSSGHASERMNQDDGGKQPKKVDNPDFEPQEKATTHELADSAIGSGDLEMGTSIKKRTWKKPKDKPKRPLSSYNIFFQHQRERIVEGKTGEASPEEIVQSVEAILSRPATKRRHRKSHGRISFGDLARTIAENWKSVSPKAKSIFEHYAERDSLRYKRELKLWKDKKDLELEASTMAKHSSFMNSMNMNSSLRSESSSTSAYLDSLPREGSASLHSASGHPARSFSHSFNSSMNSIDSHSFHLPVGEQDHVQQAFQRQQQLLQLQLRMDNNLNPSAGFHMSGRGGGDMPSRMTPGSNAFHSSFSSLPTNRMSISNCSVDAVGSSSASAAASAGGFGGLGEAGMGQHCAMDSSTTSAAGGAATAGDDDGPGGGVDPLLGSSTQSRFSGMMPRGPHHTRVASDGHSFGGVGNMMGHSSFSGGFMQHPSDMMMPNAAMMSMMSQQGQLSEMEFMQQKLDWLQEQQRRLQMQPQASMGPMSSMGNISNGSLQFGGDSLGGGGSGHVVSDRSHSEHTASSLSTAGHASGQGFSFSGGFTPARSFQQLQQQQQMMMMQQQHAAFGQDGGPMNISNSGRHPPVSDQQGSLNEFMSRQSYNNNMDMSNSSSRHNI